MVVKLIQIGNSKGIRIPKAILKQAGLEKEVKLRLEGQQIIIETARKKKPREGWEEAFKKAIAEHGNELTEEDKEWLDAPIDATPDEWKW
ncbi:MAG: AbrB/MazE/SpoVT family DNA-binding domain-containing protein [Dehalococcoidales bacterium]|nr:AbrB/MazE/SpoVT family DNA-binding domain-containing protein [Dehalococcoidales bacterium]